MEIFLLILVACFGAVSIYLTYRSFCTIYYTRGRFINYAEKIISADSNFSILEKIGKETLICNYRGSKLIEIRFRERNNDGRSIYIKERSYGWTRACVITLSLPRYAGNRELERKGTFQLSKLAWVPGLIFFVLTNPFRKRLFNLRILFSRFGQDRFFTKDNRYWQPIKMQKMEEVFAEGTRVREIVDSLLFDNKFEVFRYDENFIELEDIFDNVRGELTASRFIETCQKLEELASIFPEITEKDIDPTFNVFVQRIKGYFKD